MQIDIPGYKIVSTLGQGGMATVYLAIQTCFEREVALKVMSPHLCTDASFGERFLREARIVSRLMHPNIVTVYDVGIHEGLYYLSMEYLPGHDLKHKRFELNLVESLKVVKDIARALDYAGRKGYVHRDVKPENIMLLEEDGRAVLMDFGIARPSDVASGMTQTGTAIGTPHYMSPEQAKGLSVDSRADLYSLGVVLFVLLTGRVPFDADSAVVVGIKHVSEAIPRLPDHLCMFQPIIDRVMAKNPDERYQTGSELIADLDTITNDQILAAVRVEDAVLDAAVGDELSPTMINPSPILTGEQIVTHPNTALADVPSAIEPYHEPVSTAPPEDNLTALPSSFSISEEERAEHRHYTAVAPAAQSNGWVGFVVLLLVIGGVFYFRNDLRLYWQDHVRPALGFEQPQPVSEPAVSSLAPSSTPTEQALIPAAPSLQAPAEANASAPDLLQQARDLRAQLTSNPEVASDLAIIYRAAMVGTDPVQQAGGREGLAELQHFYAASIIGELDVDNLASAQSYGETARSLFSEVERNAALIDALNRLEQQESLQSRLQQALAYLHEGVLDEPAGANALELYRAVLTEDPANSEARAGILAVAQRFGQLAQEKAEQGARVAALALVDKGLALAPADSELLRQQVALREQLQQQETQDEALLRKAESQHMAGRVIEPQGDNAYETYHSILARNGSNQAALEGIARIEQTLVNNIQGLIERHRLLDAQSAIASARERFPRSQALLALKVRAEQLLEQNQPTIGHMVISNREISDIQQTQAETIPADRVIFIGFEYRNFKDGTSVLQAVLYDGARSIQMAQVPVIVSGSEGIQYFRIEQPIAGFAEGGYQVDLMLDDQILVTTRFNVKK
ncbi:MAG TPA: protein kinase [Cellvibrio sp.]|nr:protein kinase [Cellvibrio sp.]